MTETAVARLILSRSFRRFKQAKTKILRVDLMRTGIVFSLLTAEARSSGWGTTNENPDAESTINLSCHIAGIIGNYTSIST